MNIIIMGRKHGQSKTLRINGLMVLVVLVGVLSFAGVFAALGYQMAHQPGHAIHDLLGQDVTEAWAEAIEQQSRDLQGLKQQSQEQIDALTVRMANLQARLLRLDALGQRLTEAAKLENGEFDFSSPPAMGGPVNSDELESYSLQELSDNIAALARQIQDREQQLKMIDQLMINRSIDSELFIAGRPVPWGWMSSSFGYRSDPISGKRAWHSGVDFAGKEGSPIIAVASGVVTFAGKDSGYGLMVEIAHAGGYSTRYAHCKELLVGVGTVVKKGQTIAKIGRSGRATGPHVHYEVLKDGKAMNPKHFIQRAAR